MRSRLSNWCGAATLLVTMAGCSTLTYQPRPLDVEALPAEYAKRSIQADALRRFVAANGYPVELWPPAEWGLHQLTLAALFFSPEIETARARAGVARADLAAAGQRSGLSARIVPEYHSRTNEDSGPWSLGLELEIALVPQAKRAAEAERSAFLADAADLDIAAAAWATRAAVRDAYLELQASGDSLALLEAQLEARKELLAMVARRVEAGMLSARDLGSERVLLSQLEFARDHEQSRHQQGLGRLAAAIGLPADIVQRMPLAPTSTAAIAFDPAAAELRRIALRNRLDVHRKLLEFGAADADLKFSVAAQNPDILLGPGYMWDQGDNVWSLAVGMSMLPAARAHAAIRQAEARRELAAQVFFATQAIAVADTEQAGTRYRGARDRIAGAERQARVQQEQESRVLRQFEAGSADRMQRVSARIEALDAQARLQAARVDLNQALAQVEDAVQRPLLDGFDVLHDAPAARLSGMSKP